MLFCCNCRFVGRYFHVLSNTRDFYRKIEFGICPKCGVYKFLDYRVISGNVKEKKLSGRKATLAFEKIIRKLSLMKHGTKSNQNFYYGDFKATKRKDSFGNTIYMQLRKNFNNEEEILGEVVTRVLKTDGGEIL